MNRAPFARTLAALLFTALPASLALAQTMTLKASHQFPGGKGDVLSLIHI